MNTKTLNAKTLPPPPQPGPEAGRQALRAILQTRSVLAALEALHGAMGDIFQIPLPGFQPVFLVGPEANRFVTVTGRDDLRWRPEGDPVTEVLRQGLLVTDGEFHDELRHAMIPSLHKQQLEGYVEAMWRRTDQVMASWGQTAEVDMLVEMRRVALLILMDSLYDVDFSPELRSLWSDILKTLEYISPGAWLILPGIPRPGYGKALKRMDQYLYRIIAERRKDLRHSQDLLGGLIASGMDDDLIRDQLITMLIAGHDTSTALLAWTLYLLGRHPAALERVQEEVDRVVGSEPPTFERSYQLDYLDQVLNEALRLYPPIHIGNRRAATDLEFQGYRIPAGTRVVYSIYLTHRHPDFWEQPGKFDPERFTPERVRQRPHYTYLPFGGGQRNCIGRAFAQVESRVVLARLLQQYDLTLIGPKVHAHMGATLEPRPGVRMRVQRRRPA